MNRLFARRLERHPPRKPRAIASRQQARTDATRRKLLGAAERIFARDGFEAARLEDIASFAGYTRGAFYANFKSKEEIFGALLEDWVKRRIAEVKEVVAQHETPAKSLRALRAHYAQIAEDRRLALLSLEFKLFAIRHPEAHARLRVRQRRFRASGGELLSRIATITGRKLPIPGTAAAAGLSALSNALLLEHLVDHATVTDADIRHLLGIFFDAVLGTKTSKQI